MKKLQPAFYYYTHFKRHSNGQEVHPFPVDLELATTDRSCPKTFVIVALMKDFEVFFQFVATHIDSVAFEVFLYLFIYFGYCFSKS